MRQNAGHGLRVYVLATRARHRKALTFFRRQHCGNQVCDNVVILHNRGAQPSVSEPSFSPCFPSLPSPQLRMFAGVVAAAQTSARVITDDVTTGRTLVCLVEEITNEICASVCENMVEWKPGHVTLCVCVCSFCLADT